MINITVSFYVKFNMQTRTSTAKERGASNEGKKKRPEENSEGAVKKPKTESSTASSVKVHE